jgi:transposase
LVLWEALTSAYSLLGFDALGDEAFRAMALARIVEPASKADTVEALTHMGIKAPAVRTLFRSLRRCQERDYRGRLAKAAMARVAAKSGVPAMVLYDVSTLHFQSQTEDDLRRMGLSKEHRIDPQVQIGLLVDPEGFPLEVHLFGGNKAETTTIVPVMEAFRGRHRVEDMVVVADAGMLSAKNLNALQDAGFHFIVGSRLTKAPYDLAEHFAKRGDYFTDGQILESSRVMGDGKAARERRVVYQYSFKRHKRDDRTINAQIERAEQIISGAKSPRNARFLKVSGAAKTINDKTIDRARQLAGLKGYVTDLPVGTLSGAAVIRAYHDLWHVEESFRLTKNDLKARPVFHHRRDSIEAHLTVVFAALAVTRHMTAATGMSIKRLVRLLRSARHATIAVNGRTMVIGPEITPQIAEVLERIRGH